MTVLSQCSRRSRGGSIEHLALFGDTVIVPERAENAAVAG